MQLMDDYNPTVQQLRRRIKDLENRFKESVGGFKRDLVKQLEDSRKQNQRLKLRIKQLESQLKDTQPFSMEGGIMSDHFNRSDY